LALGLNWWQAVLAQFIGVIGVIGAIGVLDLSDSVIA